MGSYGVQLCPGLTRIGLSFPSSGGGSSSRVIQIPCGHHILAGHIFPGTERGALVVLYIVLQTAVFGSYFALFIAITITVIVVVCCVAIALLY